MRSWTGAVLWVLAGCAEEPLCGETDEGEPIPICDFEMEGAALQYCPGDHWAAPECRSCGCTREGEVLCTEEQCTPPAE
jgi:hypothetical protein